LIVQLDHLLERVLELTDLDNSAQIKRQKDFGEILKRITFAGLSPEKLG
jgi:hypothetical protein